MNVFGIFEHSAFFSKISTQKFPQYIGVKKIMFGFHYFLWLKLEKCGMHMNTFSE